MHMPECVRACVCVSVAETGVSLVSGKIPRCSVQAHRGLWDASEGGGACKESSFKYTDLGEN